MSDPQSVAFVIACGCLWLFVLLSMNWHPGQKHCRCCPNYRKKEEK